MKRTFLALLLLGALCGSASAADRKGRVGERKQNQQARVAQGVESGALTDKEAAKLEAKQKHLNRTIRKDRRDGGGLTAKERVKIEKRQDKLSREIAKEKHDKQTKP